MQTPNGTAPLFTEVGLLIKKRLQRALPLTFAQFQVLWFVAGEGRPNMQDIAKHFKITAPSATALVDELVRGNYLARRASTKDRRKVEVTLSKTGRKGFKTLMQKRDKVLNGIFKPLGAEDRKHLDRILKKIIINA